MVRMEYVFGVKLRFGSEFYDGIVFVVSVVVYFVVIVFMVDY